MTLHVCRVYAAGALLAGSFGYLYWPVIAKLVQDWGINENYSHGYLIPPIALWLAWERRPLLRSLPAAGTWWGLVIVAGSLILLLAGLLGAELFTSRIAMLGTLVGAVLFVAGRAHLRILAFPIGLLLLMIPLPAILFNQVMFPLQLLASRVGEASLAAAGIPALREGNIIVLPNMTLQVAEACSGIRSLVSLLALAIMFGYFSDSRFWARIVIAASAVPVAIGTNALRVAGTGIAAHYYGAAAAVGFFHAFSGWIVFVSAFAMLFAIGHILRWGTGALRKSRLVDFPAGAADKCTRPVFQSEQ